MDITVVECTESKKKSFSEDISEDNEEEEIFPSSCGMISSDKNELLLDEDSEGGGLTPSTSLNG